MLGTIVHIEHHSYLWIEAANAERREVWLGIEDQPVSAVRYRAIHEEEGLHPTIRVGPCVAQLGPTLVSILNFQTNCHTTGRGSPRSIEYVS